MSGSNCSGCPHYNECHSVEESGKSNNIKNKILVLSGKGGVGKSTIAANIAALLAHRGFKTGLLDIDLHGPSIPRIMGFEGKRAEVQDDGLLIPIEHSENLKVVSVGFLLEDADSALIWRGPVKQKIIKQFVEDVNWGDLDYLIVDCPPGTGDEPLAIIHELKEITGAIIVTTPQQLAISDVRKSVNFCREMYLPVLGVIENMSGFVCPDNEIVEIFKSGGGLKMAEEMDVPFLGKIPLDPQIVESCDKGQVFSLSKSLNSDIFNDFIDKIQNFSEQQQKMLQIV